MGGAAQCFRLIPDYSPSRPPFPPSSAPSPPSHATPAPAMYDPQASMTYDQTQGAGDEQFISTFFCRALYDYQTNDSSSLSFRKGDVIEVLTQLESGWWDGLLNDERGWFPSNYVTMISDPEAEAALNGSEYPGSQASLPDDSMVDMAHTMSQALSQSDRMEIG